MIRKVVRKLKTIVGTLLSYKETEKLKRIRRSKRAVPGNFNADRLRIKFPDSVTFVFTYKEIFRQGVYKFHAKNNSPFIIDCGANIGISVLYFKQLYPAAKILAFEPDEEMFLFLKENIHANMDEKDIVLLNKGVWNEEGFISFKNEGTLGGRIKLTNDTVKFKNETIIETVKLSNYINSNVDFLKLDIEGAEVKVMEEIENKLHFVDHIFIEYHSLAAADQELQSILDILSRNNFRYYIDTPFHLRKHPFIDRNTILSFDSVANIFAVKQK